MSPKYGVWDKNNTYTIKKENAIVLGVVISLKFKEGVLYFPS